MYHWGGFHGFDWMTIRGKPSCRFSVADSRAALRMAALAILVNSESFSEALGLTDFREDGFMGGRLVDDRRSWLPLCHK
jgi:hypothetical protein